MSDLKPAPLGKLLIVDDEAALMQALCGTLEPSGYVTSGFTSASQALETLRREPFDLVLTDLMMPEMDGVSLLRAAFEIDPNLVGIVMTGHGTVDTAVNALQTGALDYILKPFKLSAVLPVLSRALSLRQLRVENIQLREAVTLHELSVAIACAQDVETVISKVADAAFEQSRAKGLSILLPVEDGREFEVAAARGEVRELQGKRVRAVGELSGWVDRCREILGAPEDLREAAAVPAFLSASMAAGLSIPMLSGARQVGILHFTPAETSRPVTLGQIKALSILATAGASALEATLLMDQLRAAEQRYRQLAEDAPDVVCRYEIEPQLSFAYVNPAITALTGYTPKDCYQDPGLCLGMVHAEDRAEFERVLAGKHPSGSAVTLRWVHRNGNVVWVEQKNKLVLDRDGAVVAVESIARDITERKMLEEQLRHSQKLEAIGQLTAGVAHDFNNLLTVINGYSDLALKEMEPAAPARRKVVEVRKAGEQAAGLTRQLLASSRRQMLQPRAVLLSEVLREMEDILRSALGDKVELCVSAAEGLGSVLIDPMQVQQVILNLAVNARDAMPNGGTLLFEARNADARESRKRLGETPSAPFVSLTVADNGCGMTPEVLRRAFEPFFTTKESGRGTGLGLSTVCGIVEQSGGRIFIESELGSGTTFTILLPRLETSREGASEASADHAVRPAPRSILVVDDEAPIRNLLAEVLSEAGYVVLTAKDGHDALSQVAEHPVDLVITDLAMPEMEGIEFIKAVRKRCPQSKLIAMSGAFGSEILRAAESLGAHATLSKPLTPEMVLDCIEGLSENRDVSLARR